MKSAILHDWLVDFAGGESVLEAIYEIYPSPVYTLFADKKSLQGSFLKDASVYTSSLQKIPFITKAYRKLLALFPRAVEEFDFSGYDIVLSTSHSVAKGALTNANQLHICYIHTPMRYAWDLYFQYFREANIRGLKKTYASKVLHEIRKWDIISANRVDYFIANSKYIARRVRKVYGRDASVIYPPVGVERFPLFTGKENYYVTASRMVPYKKIDLIAKAFAMMPDKRLRIIGDGPDMKKVRAAAKNAGNIEIMGYQSFETLKDTVSKAKAFVFAAEEDFGIVPVEAQACGTPVIAYGRGGARETVLENKTGLFFDLQTPQSIMDAVLNFEKIEDKFDHTKIRKHAESFSKERFINEYKSFVEEKYAKFNA